MNPTQEIEAERRIEADADPMFGAVEEDMEMTTEAEDLEMTPDEEHEDAQESGVMFEDGYQGDGL